MALNIIKFLRGIRLIPNSSTVITAKGEMEVLDSDGKLYAHDGTSAKAIVTETGTATLTGKTLTTPIINEIVTSTDTNLNLNPNGTGKVVTDNLAFSGNTIQSTNTDGDINITPNGTGAVVLTNATITTSGQINVDNLRLDGNTLSSTNTNGDVNISPNGSGTVVVNTDLDVDNLNLNGNTIISTNTDGNINITPNGTGSVVLSKTTISSGTATLASADITSITSAGGTLGNISVGVSDDNTIANGTSTITINGTGGTTVGTLLNVDNIRLDGNTLSTTNTNGDLTLTPNGTGTVVVSTDLDVDNINVNSNTISTTNTDGNLNLTPNGVGVVSVGGAGINSGAFNGGDFDGDSGRFGDINVNPTDGVISSTAQPLTLTSASGTVVASGALQVDNLNLNGNTISATGGTDITITPNGAGSVIISTDLDVDNININANTISSTNTNGSIVLDPNGTGQVQLETAATLPEISTPTTPSSGYGKVYFKSDGKLYQLNDAGTETEVGAAGGSGGINYIDNFDAETDTTGWAAYSVSAANVPGTIPSGGTATGVTFSRSTSSPLRGVGSFSVVKDGSSRQGKGVSYPFSIDTADLAKMLSISFDFNASSGFTASDGTTPPLNDGTTTTNAGNSDLEVFIWDTSNSRLIPVTPQVVAAKGTNNFTFTGQFQTDSTSQSYVLALHIATTSTTAWTFKYDNVFVGPSYVYQGPPVSDPVAYTPTGAWVANTTYYGTYQRIGSDARIRGRVTLAGAPTSATFTFTLPSGLVIDTTKLPNGTAIQYQTPLSGVANALDSGSGIHLNVAYNTTTSITLLYQSSTAAANALVTQAGPITWGNTDGIDLDFVVPIVGWSSNVVMSSDADTRVVVCGVTGNPAAATTGNPIIFPTITFDTHGVYNTTTGRYTVPVSGYYDVYGFITANVTQSIEVFVNAVFRVAAGRMDTTTSVGEYIATIAVNAGDIVDIRPTGNLDVGAGSTMFIKRISGPVAIAASETISASYYANTNSAATTATPIDFNTKVYDSHNAVTTGAAWKFTAPMSGIYNISGWSIGNAATASYIRIYKSGVFYKTIAYSDAWGSRGAGFTGDVQLLAGEYVDLRPSGNTTFTGNASLGNDAASNVQIKRIGNYAS